MGKTGGVYFHQGGISSMDLKPGGKATRTRSVPKAKAHQD